jgi:Kef-type K+ transport system membrane component KefB
VLAINHNGLEDSALILVALGAIFLLGLATDLLGRRTFLPRVTLLIVFGAIVGPAVLDLIPDLVIQRFELITQITMLMIGFLLGGKLTVQALWEIGPQLLWISLLAALAAAIAVFAGLAILGLPLGLAVLLGCIAAATDPVATVDVVIESKTQSRFSELLVAIVAVDDAWALIIFSLGLTFVAAVNGNTEMSPLLAGLQEIAGSLLLGFAVGLPGAYLTGRVRQGQPMLTEALGLVFVCGGLAIWLDVSFLLAAMAMGMTVANLATHHEYPFHAIEGIEWPFMVIFFILAGASLEFASVVQAGLIGLVFIACRVIGKVVGATLGGLVSGAEKSTNRWIGVALLPQAGAAVGMALVAAKQFPQYQNLLLTIVIGSTVLFELAGPVLTRLALTRTETE